MMKKNNLKRIFAALSVTALLAQPIGMQVSAKPANALKQDAAPVVLAEDPKIPLKEDFTFALAADQSAVYDGTAKTLIAKFLPNEAVSVTLKTYDVSGKETAMLQAGTYTVKATMAADGDYDAVSELEIGTFTVSPKTLNAENIADIPAQFFTGSPVEPELTVTDGETKLVKTTDYTVSFESNTVPGTAKATITFTGNYSGTAEKTFVIDPKAFAGEIADIPAQTYTGSPIEPEINVTDGETKLVKDTDYTVAYESNTAAGTAKVTVTFIGNYSGTAEKTFVIAPKAFAGEVADIPAQFYTASPIEPELTVTDGEVKLVKDTDYTVSFESNTEPGTAKLTITFTGNYSGTAEKTFSVLPATPLVTVHPKASRLLVGKALSNSKLSGGVVLDAAGKELPGTFSWQDDSEVMKETGNYTRNIVFVPNDTAHYNSVELDVEVVVYKISQVSAVNYYTYYTVSYQTNGGSSVASTRVRSGYTASEPDAPERADYDFAGWYTDKNLKNAYNFSSKVTSNITLYAKWVKKDNSANEIILTIGSKNARVFGERVSNDVAPLIVNDRTMLPARFVAESLGAKVSWNEEEEIVTISGFHLKTGKPITILITIGSDKATVNGKTVTLDSSAFLQNDRTYTPIRFISEELGAEVEWIEDDEQVIITRPEDN